MEFYMPLIKKCYKCGETKNKSEFNKDKSRKDGVANKCKQCQKIFMVQYSKENKDKLKEYWKEASKLRYVKNKEHILMTNKKWQQENKEYSSIKSKKYREKNKERIIIRSHKYMQEHLEEYRIRGEKRKALKDNLPSTLTVQQWENIKNHFKNRCAYCNKELPLAQEHFIALSKGGEYTVNNIIPSCQSCNSSKGTKKFLDWYLKYKYYSKTRERAILKFLNYENGFQQLKII